MPAVQSGWIREHLCDSWEVSNGWIFRVHSRPLAVKNAANEIRVI
jgi:hypothetical protein